MKKLTIILSALILAISASAFTKDETVSAKVKAAFQKTFTSATDVYWKKVNEFYLANFRINDQSLSAAYDEDGKLISASRSVTLAELPLAVSFCLKNQFEGYTFQNIATEITLDGETSYYINAENTKRAVTIKATGSGESSIVKKAKKK
jgi:hypothetical protein